MTTASRLSMPLGEAIYSLRAIRRFKSDPIPDSDLRDIMEATIRAPNGGNTQPWHFIVIKDRNCGPSLLRCTERPGGRNARMRGFAGRRISRRARVAASRR